MHLRLAPPVRLRRALVSLLASLTTLGFVGAALAHEPLPLVPRVDPARYVGTWYEITKLPNFFTVKSLCDFVERKLGA